MTFKKGPDANRNIGGRMTPPRHIRDLAQSLTTQAMETLQHWMKQRVNPAASVHAARIIIERGWGKPDQNVNLNAAVLITHQMMTEQAEKILADAKTIENGDATCLPNSPTSTS